jgi:long-chain acyl-CoA synthetase
MDLATLPDERALSDPNARCLSDEHGQLDNKVFASRVRALAGWLREEGIRSGDVVAAMLPNRVELAMLLFAAWRVAAVLTPLNPGLTAEEANYQLADSKARLTVVDAASFAKIDRSVSLVAAVDELWTVGGLNELPPAVAEPDRLALLIYTSGTTGRPKGVMLDHGNISAMTDMIVEALRLGSSDRALLILPLFHASGLLMSVVAPLAAGGSAHIGARFDAQTFWMEIERTRPTFVSAVPTIFTHLAALPDGAKTDASWLRFVLCCAAPAPIEELRAFERRYGVPVIEGYGLSEATFCSTINPVDGRRKAGSVGLPLAGQEVRIADGEGHFLPAGRTGEIVVRGPNVMRGYLGRPDDTARALQGGWLHTGDVGHFDDGGHLYLVDRVRDMIIRGGENVYPREIESVLHGHPAVLEAVVVGRPDAILGEEPVAFVSLRSGRTVEPEELIEHCRKSLARFKVPRAIYIEASLPKNPMGKLVKGPLRERVRDVA